MRRKTPLKFAKKIPFGLIGLILVMLTMLTLLLVHTANSSQAMSASYSKIIFEGSYRIGEGPWQPVVQGQHIPSTRGDVTLEGYFRVYTPNNEYIGTAEEGFPIAFYLNHIHVTVFEGAEPFAFAIEHPLAGEGMCGVSCISYSLRSNGPVSIVFHNPHRYGNENAIDDFLQELSVYPGAEYAQTISDQGNGVRSVGIVLAVVSFTLLGTALFSSLLHLSGSGKMWLSGLSILFAGGYFIYGSKGVFCWSDSVIWNTTLLGICMMLYTLFASCLICQFLSPRLRKSGIAAATVCGVCDAACSLLALLTEVRFYDTWLWWAMIHCAVAVFLLVLLSLDFGNVPAQQKLLYIAFGLLLIAYCADAAATFFGWWQGGLLSRYIFLGLFAVVMVTAWRIIPQGINAAIRTKEAEAQQKVLQAQLQENRIAIMISQIQPHFIYNTLGTIQQLCLEDPKQASALVQSFSLYLRGNFSELDSTAPIRFAQELEHIRYYTQIENIRFPDMTVLYDIQCQDFLLPALSVQPLVENAIKHGLMGLEQGGTVTISTYETGTHYCVQVKDDGVGFCTDTLQEGKKHIGIRNVRERLQAMCNGQLILESQPGKGACARILIPKEANV